MPTFPAYSGELPFCLNPLNPRHYFLLAYWLYFRPTAFRYYLYQADPDFYRSGPGINIFRSFAKPAYLNLYVIALFLSGLLSICIGVPVVQGASLLQQTVPLWREMAIGVAGGLAIGLAIGLAMGFAAGSSALCAATMLMPKVPIRTKGSSRSFRPFLLVGALIEPPVPPARHRWS